MEFGAFASILNRNTILYVVVGHRIPMECMVAHLPRRQDVKQFYNNKVLSCTATGDNLMMVVLDE